MARTPSPSREGVFCAGWASPHLLILYNVGRAAAPAAGSGRSGTRGIDVGAKIEVYHVMNDLVKAGKCVIMVSSELPEILAMSDHVVVMRGGRVMANIDRDTPHFNSEDIMKAAWGGELD